MKKSKLMNVGKALLGIGLLSLVLLATFAPELVPHLAEWLGMGAGAGQLLANTAIVGTSTYQKTEDSSPDHQERDVSQVVTEMKPDEFPLDTMIRTLKRTENAKNVKVEYETVKFRGRQSKVTTLFTAAADATDESVLLEVDNIDIWGIHDTAVLPGITGADGHDLRLFVMEVVRADNELRVTAINSPTADTQRVPTIALNTPVRRMGVAKEELDAQTDVITQEPTLDFNYCQIQMAQISQSVLKSLMKTYSGYSYKDRYVQEIYNMRSSCEQTHLYGARGKVLNKVTNKYHYTADGIKKRIKNTVTFEGNDTTGEVITRKDVNKLLEQAFSGNAGSEERLLIAGSTIIRHLQDISYDKNLGSMQTKIVHGVQVSQLETNFGLVNIKHNKTMDINDDQELGMLIDLKHIWKHDLEKMKTEDLDLNKSGQSRETDTKRIIENSCLTVRYDDVHYIWKRDAANSN